MYRQAIHFGTIIDRIETYHEKADYEDDITTGIGKRLFAVCASLKRGVDASGQADDCYFYINTEFFDEVIAELEEQPPHNRGIIVQPENYFGCPVRSHETMPKNKLLLMSPNAVTLGGKVIDPDHIGLGTILNDS